MGFSPGGVCIWVMGYRGCMGYDLHFSANRLGGPKKVWGKRGMGYLSYGLL